MGGTTVNSGPQREKTKQEAKTKEERFSAKESTYGGLVRDLAEEMFAFRRGRPHSIRTLQKCFSGCEFCFLASKIFQERQGGHFESLRITWTPPAASGDICY